MSHIRQGGMFLALYMQRLLLTLQTRFKAVRAPLGPKRTISTWLGMGGYTFTPSYCVFQDQITRKMIGHAVRKCRLYYLNTHWKIGDSIPKILLPPTIPQKLIKYGYGTNGWGTHFSSSWKKCFPHCLEKLNLMIFIVRFVSL